MAAEPASEPDAALIALADEIMSIYRESNRLSEEAESLSGATAHRFHEERVRPLVDREWDLRVELALLPATTLAGFRAKARVLQEFNNCAPGYAEPWNDDAMAWSLANDLLGVPSIWRADDEEDAA